MTRTRLHTASARRSGRPSPSSTSTSSVQRGRADQPARPVAAAARPPRCASPPASSSPTAARSSSAAPTSPACRPTSATWAWCSRATACSPTSTCRPTSTTGCARASIAKADAAQRVGEMLELVQLSRTWPTAIRTSSRAASSSASRSPAPSPFEPQVLLLDEPLSALDAKVRVDLARRDPPHPDRARHHDAVRHPRPGGGAGDLRPHRGDVERPTRAARHADARSTARRRPRSSPASSAR